MVQLTTAAAEMVAGVRMEMVAGGAVVVEVVAMVGGVVAIVVV